MHLYSLVGPFETGLLGDGVASRSLFEADDELTLNLRSVGTLLSVLLCWVTTRLMLLLPALLFKRCIFTGGDVMRLRLPLLLLGASTSTTSSNMLYFFLRKLLMVVLCRSMSASALSIMLKRLKQRRHKTSSVPMMTMYPWPTSRAIFVVSFVWVDAVKASATECDVLVCTVSSHMKHFRFNVETDVWLIWSPPPVLVCVGKYCLWITLVCGWWICWLELCVTLTVPLWSKLFIFRTAFCCWIWVVWPCVCTCCEPP